MSYASPNFQTVTCANCFAPIEVISPDESESYTCEPSCADSKPANIREVNAALKAAGFIGVIVRQGRGYVYFSGPAVATCFEQSANVRHVSHLTFAEWLNLATDKVQECRIDELTTAADFQRDAEDDSPIKTVPDAKSELRKWFMNINELTGDLFRVTSPGSDFQADSAGLIAYANVVRRSM